ncbi:hypothetical protein F2Q70_00026248 [Brassica cretica]|uniref:Uncharacterized protein n=1 Tax=Brassica cretica TaxID=69181 RepID=A0A8S9LEA5_BRACR|nr:hypothetical protein F2Q70_00026248 [Brassica cretica]
MDDRGVLRTSLADAKSTSIDSNKKPSIDAHHTLDSEVHIKDNTDYGYLTPDEFGIFMDPEGQARAMDGRILNISKEDITEIIAMNRSRNFMDTQTRVEDPPSVDKYAAPSINDQYDVRQGALHQNRKRKPRWEYTETPIPTVPDETSYNKADIDEMVAEIYRVLRTSDDYHSKRLDDIYYPFDNIINCLTTHTYEMKHNIAMIQTHHVVGARESKSIDDHTQPSIDARTRTSIDP